ncbi:MAG: ATP-binding protein [Blautia sp.]|jgi:hypothetical protein
MNIKRAKEEIKDAILAYLYKNEYGEYEIPTMRQRPILLLGAPGIGKTQIMEQIARECRIGLVSYTITHHTRQSAIGLPFISEKTYGGECKHVTEYTMSEIVASIYDQMELTGQKEGILFIDEINCVSETLAPAMLQFLQCKTFGNHAIPKGWLIVAAGNPPEYNKSVREFDVVTMDRVKKIPVEPDFDAWKEYAYKENIHPAVISYLNTRPSYFYRMESTVDGRQFATPRGWEDLSRMIAVYEKLGKTVDREVVVQYIQYEKIAKDFANYLELYYKYQADYQVEAIFRGEISQQMVKKLAHASFDERLSVVGLLLAGCNRAFGRVQKARLRLERLLAAFGECKPVVLGPQCQQPVEFLEDYRQRLEETFVKERTAGLLDREEEHICRDLLQTFDELLLKLKKEDIQDGEAAFARMQEIFGQSKAVYETAYDEAGDALEKAFDFMEAAFTDGQEMVIFITELNTGYDSIRFLQEYDCERYYRYNKELLFREKRSELLRQIDE